METYNPPHEPTDDTKVVRMVEAIRRGGRLPPIVVNGENALTGSHRIEAYRRAGALNEACFGEGWERAELTIPTVEIDDDEYLAACASVDVEHLGELGDYNEQCVALYNSCEREDVRAALEDQR